jgi:hypothetical protein
MAAGGDFDQALREFIAEHISSIVELELILLLRAQAPRDWSAAEVARELRIEIGWTQQELAALTARGILAMQEGAEPRYRYEPATSEMADLIARLARLYTERRVTTITIIYSTPRDPLTLFAEAFRLRKDKDQ